MTIAGGTRISADEVRLLRQLWADGVGLAEIGIQLGGIGVHAVRYRARQAGLGPHPSTASATALIKDERLRCLWNDGASYRQIADDLGCSISAVEYRVARLGLPRRRHRIDPNRAAERDKAIIEMFAAGMTVAAVAKAHRVSLKSVESLIRRREEQGRSLRAAATDRSSRRSDVTQSLFRQPAPSLHPFWTIERDAAIIATQGAYAALSAAAARLGIPSSRAVARYLVLREDRKAERIGGRNG